MKVAVFFALLATAVASPLFIVSPYGTGSTYTYSSPGVPSMYRSAVYEPSFGGMYASPGSIAIGGSSPTVYSQVVPAGYSATKIIPAGYRAAKVAPAAYTTKIVPAGYQYKGEEVVPATYSAAKVVPAGYEYKAEKVVPATYSATMIVPAGYEYKAEKLVPTAYSATKIVPAGYEYKAEKVVPAGYSATKIVPAGYMADNAAYKSKIVSPDYKEAKFAPVEDKAEKVDYAYKAEKVVPAEYKAEKVVPAEYKAEKVVNAAYKSGDAGEEDKSKYYIMKYESAAVPGKYTRAAKTYQQNEGVSLTTF